VRALILAAGVGSRLGALTDAVPKPMLEVGGAPILEHNVRALVAAGVRDIAINLHHRGEAIEDHFGDGARFGARIRYSRETELRGTAGALLPLTDYFTETFLVLFGDNLSTCDLSRVIARHRSAGAEATVALFHRDDVGASGIALLDGDDRIVRFIEKPRPEEAFSKWVNAGIVVAEPGVLAFVPRDRPSDMGRDVLPALLAAGSTVAGYRMSEGLWWIDTPEDYERTKTEFAAARSSVSPISGC
jgi:mannose-1-phosphate guanylyltransferase